ncbi:hypothetical protein DSO57_1022661 [Entomophthora muscae]|uniref:Uncharacterized protein n=1 Tax=Entomophthora muscae TaxID=34485 RepID=A0ACC2U1L5_9FUNG|nr:hypothetical protein DSO57_1022661 [Entomophthora muscae]
MAFQAWPASPVGAQPDSDMGRDTQLPGACTRLPPASQLAGDSAPPSQQGRPPPPDKEIAKWGNSKRQFPQTQKEGELLL